MIEHDPWVATRSGGIGEQSIAIVGYSHHLREATRDHRRLTNIIVRDVIAGKQRGDSFFPRVPTYFGYADSADFWPRVMFFNFLPCAIGTRSDKYKTGSPLQLECARERFCRILREHKPQRVFVFTTKGGTSAPTRLVNARA
jgi:hypothetical protein